MRIQTNTAANSALGYMRVNNQATERSIQKLSSGFRINRAADDAAGLAIANKLRSDIKGLGQAQRNVAQGSAMLQVMDGATQTVGSIVDRMKELATQANSANVGTQSDKLQSEFTQLRSEIDRIVGTTNYQGTKLVDGSFGYRITGASAAVPGTPGTPAVPAAVAATGTGDFAGFSASITNQTQANALTSDITFSSDGTDVTATWAGGGTATITAANLAAGGTFALGTSGVSVSFAANTPTTAGDAGTVAVTQFQAAVAATTGTPAVAGTRTGSTGSFQVSSSGNYALGDDDQVQVAAVNLSTGTAGLNLASLDISSQAGAAAALSALDDAVNTVNGALGNIGSAQSRMDFAAANVATQLQNTQAAESTIRDADMAAEMTSFTKNNILQQAAQSMLSQANQGTQGILQLLRG
jgi:flagellin